MALRFARVLGAFTFAQWPLPFALHGFGYRANGASKALELQLFPTGTWNQTARTDGENEDYWTLELVKLD